MTPNDLWYFHLKDLQHIKDKKAYYISRIKSNTRIYQKNFTPNSFQDGRIKKGTEYIQIDRYGGINELSPTRADLLNIRCLCRND